jgi:hypothetical protein
MGEIRHESSRQIDGLKWPSREGRSPFASAYLQKGITREGERGLLTEGEKESPPW